MGFIANTKYLHNGPHSQQNGFYVISLAEKKRVIYDGRVGERVARIPGLQNIHWSLPSISMIVLTSLCGDDGNALKHDGIQLG